MLIEQAIFTSTQTNRLDGYQLAVYSPEICAEDLRELAVWGPSHDSLLESGEDAVSINFHRLPSGAYCVSKTTPAGSEYSGRTGPKIYTQCLIVDAETLARFANNPFALLTAAFAQGSLKVHDPLPESLEAFRLAGKAAVVDQALLAQLLSEPGATWLGALVEAALRSPSLALIAAGNGIRLIHGLINCLPLECRTEFSFCTGLKHSPRRPFRIFCLGDDPTDQRRILRQQETTVLELSGKPPKQFTATTGWSGFVALVIASGKTSFLAQQLAKPRPGLSIGDLTALGNELLEVLAESAPAAAGAAAHFGEPESAHLGEPEALASGSLPEGGPGAPARPNKPEGGPGAPARPNDAAETAPAGRGRPALHDSPNSGSPNVASGAVPPADEQHRADAAHRRFLRAVQSAIRKAPGGIELDPAQVLGTHCPAALEQLERLDDAVFEAIAGKPGALDELRKLWPEVLSQLGPELVEESREQYVRHALRVWRDCVEGDQIRNPTLAVAAMDVVCLLFGE
ncbi:MAG TPA: hypothetical protein VMV10_25305 [Pirellulales bacterium]|nr:hypothetical protein [Pirellulales bacterium]